ncbi:MAG: TonB-dependent receptor [Bacteroidota bacterium]|nr:TonB-dependent receptor [Bacteroidota bacterium]
MKHILLLLLASLTFVTKVFTQDISVRGVVMEEKQDGSFVPLEFVQVYWLKSQVNTNSDSTGYFFIPHATEDGDQLAFRYLGYDTDTVKVTPGQYISVVFKEQNNILGEVVVAHHKRSTEVSFLDPLQVQNISKEELFKAACCNLSESFETNATIDVSFTDAVTGAKEIQMLGLSGKYSLISQEQMPCVRGLAIPYGLLYTPGAWIESIQISKGAGSVIQGYESMTGQINVELKKPNDEDKLLLNGYFNESYRSELNLFTKTQISPMFATALLGHYSIYPKKHDRNNDGFADMPEGDLITFANRWDYHNNKTGLEGQLNVQWLKDAKQGGHASHREDEPGHYTADIDGERLTAMMKIGYLFPKKRYNSIGSQWGFTRQLQSASIGNNIYDGKQISLSGNWLYQSIISDSRHQYVTGLSFRYDDYDERFGPNQFAFKEIVPGAFFEYTYKPDDRVTLVAGVRADQHSIYGLLFNPRLHFRYAPSEQTVFRASVGKGMRTSLPVAENLGLLASSRQWKFDGETNSEKPYGLNMEQAWNMGVSYSQEFSIDYRSGLLAVDFFHTRFTDRTIVDLDISPQQLWIYNLEGNSYANTFQIEAQYELLKRLDAKVAYKWQDSRITYRNEGLRRQIFTPAYRLFANLSYVSSVATYRGHWRVSLTGHLTGSQRIPDTDTNPEAFQLAKQSPSYWLFNGQLTRVFSKNFELYAGVENIANYKQSPVIVDADHPYSPYFDSGLIWGPIFGREWYVGFRYVIK